AFSRYISIKRNGFDGLEPETEDDAPRLSGAVRLMANGDRGKAWRAQDNADLEPTCCVASGPRCVAGPVAQQDRAAEVPSGTVDFLR
ncbi:MAG: hypothetical protein AAFU66_09960, partial [Pseudomonadota bacterium]